MKLSEMSSNQLENRKLFIQKLAIAKWTGRPLNDLFEKGFWVDSEATMDFSNQNADLILNFIAKDNTIELLIDSKKVSPAFGRLDFVFKYNNNLIEILDAIINNQSNLCFESILVFFTSFNQKFNEQAYIINGQQEILLTNDVLNSVYKEISGNKKES